MAHKQTIFNFFKGNVMTLDEIKKILKDRNLKAVALATGLNPHTLYRLVNGGVTPHHATQQVIATYLKDAN
jgi:predicted transcriptional regulator